MMLRRKICSRPEQIGKFHVCGPRKSPAILDRFYEYREPNPAETARLFRAEWPAFFNHLSGTPFVIENEIGAM